MSALHVELLTKARERIQSNLNESIIDALSKDFTTSKQKKKKHTFSKEALDIVCHLNTLSHINSRINIKSNHIHDDGIHVLDVNPSIAKNMRLYYIAMLIEEWRDAP